MTKQRNQENEAFLNAKKDDQDAIKLLEAAREALTKYYKKNKKGCQEAERGAHREEGQFGGDCRT